MDSEAKTILEEGIPLDNSADHSVGSRPANAYVYVEKVGYKNESRLVIYPKADTGALFIDMEHIYGDIAPGH